MTSLDPNNVAIDPVNLLIIDYDVTRFHTFDVFRWCLLDKVLFSDMIDEIKPMVYTSAVADQVDFYRLNCISSNPLNHFKQYRDHPGNTKDFMEQIFSKACTDTKVKITKTDISTRLNVILSNKLVSGILLQYQFDPHVPEFTEVCDIKTEKWDSITDVRKLVSYTIEHQINAVMCGNIDLLTPYLILLSEKVKTPMQVFICKYGYNYEWRYPNQKPVRVLRYTPMLAALEEKYKYSFALVDSYSGLTYRDGILNRERRLHNEDLIDK